MMAYFGQHSVGLPKLSRNSAQSLIRRINLTLRQVQKREDIVRRRRLVFSERIPWRVYRYRGRWPIVRIKVAFASTNPATHKRVIVFIWQKVKEVGQANTKWMMRHWAVSWMSENIIYEVEYQDRGEKNWIKSWRKLFFSKMETSTWAREAIETLSNSLKDGRTM